MPTYEFKRGLFRKKEVWTLDDTSLSREDERVILADVIEVMFEEAASPKAMWVTGLKLKTRLRTCKLQCNDDFAGKDRVQFVAMCADTLTRLVDIGSQANVRASVGLRVLAWTLAIGGVALILLGAAILQEHLDTMKDIGRMAIGGALILFGAFLFFMGAPWKTVPKQTLPEVRDQVLEIRAKQQARL